MSFFNSRQKPVLFITKDFKGKLQQKSDLILSPEFYWVKKAALNLRYSYEAGKMAASIFDGILPHDAFKYKVFKSAKGEFIFIAYDQENIQKELKHIGIDMNLVDKIYTAQSELMHEDIALRAGESEAIVSNEGVIVCLPSKFIDTSLKMDINDVIVDRKLTSGYIYHKSIGAISIGEKESNLILSFLIILVCLLGVNIAKITKERNFLEIQKNTMIKQYDLPETTFQIKSMQEELSKIDREQTVLRGAIEYLGKFKLLKSESFRSLSFKKHVLKIILRLKGSDRDKELHRYISGRYKISNFSHSRDLFTYEIAL